jgi:hypothetical protein
MLFKNSVRTSKRTPHLTITKINWLTLFKFKAAYTVGETDQKIYRRLIVTRVMVVNRNTPNAPNGSLRNQSMLSTVNGVRVYFPTEISLKTCGKCLIHGKNNSMLGTVHFLSFRWKIRPFGNWLYSSRNWLSLNWLLSLSIVMLMATTVIETGTL